MKTAEEWCQLFDNDEEKTDKQIQTFVRCIQADDVIRTVVQHCDALLIRLESIPNSQIWNIITDLVEEIRDLKEK